MQQLADAMFERAFQHLFVYNILYEDSEVDEQHLGIDEGSSVLGISGAGCRIAGHVSQRPRHIDAVDINGHHLALTALKVSAAQTLGSYETFYELLGHGKHRDPQPLVGRLTGHLPSWIQEHWRRHHPVFARGLYAHGLTSRLLRTMRRLTGVDEAWLRGLIPLSAEERIQRTLATFAPVLQQRWLTALLESPLHLVSIGVNFAQKSKMLRMEGADSTVEFLLMYFMRLAQTDLGRNWFAWHAIAGHFDHHAEGAVPPYLRRGHHERSYRSPTQVRYHRRNIFEVLGDGGKDQWSHFTFCDAPDWMTDEAQQRLFREVLRTGREGGVLQYRSVERDSLVARHGLDRHLVPMREETASATAADRTRQYRGVNFYRIVH